MFNSHSEAERDGCQVCGIYTNTCVVLLVLLLLLLFVYNAFIVSDMCLCRWAQLRMIIYEIETNVEALRVNHSVSLRLT